MNDKFVTEENKSYHLFKQTTTDICMSCFNSLLRYTKHYTQLQQSSDIFIIELPISNTLLKLLTINFLKHETVVRLCYKIVNIIKNDSNNALYKKLTIRTTKNTDTQLNITITSLQPYD